MTLEFCLWSSHFQSYNEAVIIVCGRNKENETVVTAHYDCYVAAGEQPPFLYRFCFNAVFTSSSPLSEIL